VHVALDPEIDTIPWALSAQVVAAMREILSNIVRHSQATEVDVALSLSPRKIRLEVRDDGVGFLPHVGPGRGLRNLVSRARELGGECTVDANPGRGTTITWEAAR
jgi:signal transduction histidine kinase